jgi:2-iminobutanoate/2-iminopropanoate deaminase
MNQIINTPNAPAAIGPYAQGVITNNILYTSGQIALNPITNELELSSIKEETNRVMNNLSAILKAANTGFSKVIKATIFLKNMDDFSEVNEIYASYFSDKIYPARETVQVTRLPKNVNVEISMIASL